MKKSQNLFKYLKKVEYPGRGIVIGISPEGDKAMVAYWIMGRSENSRNRVFEKTDDGIRTVAADPAKILDPHLIIYNAVKTVWGATVVTNGDQTDTIADYITNDLYPGFGFDAALSTRTFEDDAPNYTPRISGIVGAGGTGAYRLNIIKTDKGDPSSVERHTFDYPQPLAGEGHFISTYRADQKKKSALESFSGSPKVVEIPTGDPQELAGKIWKSLNKENRVSLFVRAIDLSNGTCEDVVINKYSKVRAEGSEPVDTEILL